MPNKTLQIAPNRQKMQKLSETVRTLQNYPQENDCTDTPTQTRQARRDGLGKQVSQFGERLAVCALDGVDATITAGLNAIIQLVDADRICWYEVDQQSAALMHKYTASARQAPVSPKVVPPGAMPFLAQRLARHEIVALETLGDMPPQGSGDRQFLAELGVKSLLLIPSSYNPRRKGVLGLSSYSVEVNWPEESVNHLTMAANIIGATLERKDAQTASQENHERFRYLFAQASIGIALETLDGRILEVNPAFCALMGYTLQEMQSLSCSRISHPDDEEIEKVLFEELRQGQRTSYRIEKRFFHKDGTVIWGQVGVSLLNTNHGGAPLVIGMVSDITAQKNAEASLRQRDREMQKLTRRLIEVQEQERHRISRELHDDIGQRIALAANEIDLVRREEPADRLEHASERLAKLHKELDAIATDIHKLSHELQSATLQCCGLRIALKDLCWKYSKNYDLEIELQAAELDAKLSPDVALCLFRVAQEALANVVKHGQTKKVRVATSQDAGRARLTVKDYGVGFDPAMDSEGIGLIGMRERVRFCGGLLLVKSAPNLGTEITAEVAVTKDMAAIAND